MRLAERLLYDIVREILETGNGDIDYCDDYAEPGYSTETDGAPILFADWNTYSGTPGADTLRAYELNHVRSVEDVRAIYNRRLSERAHRNRIARIGALADRLGWGVEWSDEWYRCDDNGSCNKAVRSQGDSYSWKPSYFMGDGEIQCHECVRDDPEALEEHLTDNPDSADTIGIDWAARGWRLTRPQFESGWHPGQDDNPAAILEKLNLRKVSALFEIDYNGQFDTGFSLWIRPLNSRHGTGTDYAPPSN